MSKKFSPHLKGFLLFELVVAVMILSVFLTVISRSLISSLSALQTSSHHFKAGLLLEKKLLEIWEKPLSGKEEGVFEEFGRLFHWTVEARDLEEPPLYETLVTVAWKRGVRENQLRVTTYLPKTHEE